MSSIFQLRRDTAANWALYNPIPRQGEPCVELDTLRVKIGDGVSEWSALSYLQTTVNIVDDVAPRLGGNLNCDIYEIQVEDQPIKFYVTGRANYTELRGGDVTSNLVFYLPTGYGTDGMIMTSDGAGSLEFEWKYEFLDRTQLGSATVGLLMYWVAPRDLVIEDVEMFLRVKPGIGSVIGDIRLGVDDSLNSILVDNQITIADTAALDNGLYKTTGVQKTGTTTVTAGQAIWFRVISIGVVEPGQDLTFRIKYR